MDVVLLGSGNVATHLGAALHANGHRVLQVYSRSLVNAQQLAERLGALATDHTKGIDPHADLYILSVKDDAIAPLAAQLPDTLGGAVIHTAGSVDMQVLKGKAARYGVFYPVQTFSKAKAVDFSAIPIGVEASDGQTHSQLIALAESLSPRVFDCDSQQRLSLHLAAVFACNFANHFYAIGADILHAKGLDFDLIRPLILETAEKVMQHGPRDVQTGPAVRHDQDTMAKHLEALKDLPDLAALYKAISQRIGGLSATS